jgi:hypothetical protein
MLGSGRFNKIQNTLPHGDERIVPGQFKQWTGVEWNGVFG